MRLLKNRLFILALLLLALCSVLLVQLGVLPFVGTRPLNVLIICADALSAGHLGVYGYDRPTSPNFDELAHKGIRFDHAYATSSWTGPSVLSVFTAAPPHVHGLQATTAVFTGGVKTLAQELSERGYRTGAVSANFVHVTPERGFSIGFEYFHVLKERISPANAPYADFATYNQVRAPRVFEVGMKWLRRRDRRPFFLYLHTMDTHAGYKATPTFARAFDRGGPKRLSGTAREILALLREEVQLQPGDLDHLVDLYDAAIASWDGALGEFLSAMDREGFLKNTLIVVFADHGEEFMDHSGFSHGITLYDEMIHVPLLIVFPAERYAGRVVRERVSLLDVGATLLQAAGVTDSRWHSGWSLMDLQEGGTKRDTIVAELGPDPPNPQYDAVPRRHRVAVLRGEWKVLSGLRGIEVFHITRDPAEQQSLPSSISNNVAPIIEAAVRIERKQVNSSVPGPPAPKDFGEKLRSLGYVK